MSITYQYMSDLCGSGENATSSGNALKVEAATIHFGAGSDVDASVATNLSFVHSIVPTSHLASLATAATYAIYIKSAIDATKAGYVVSGGVIPVTRVLADTGGTLAAADVNVLIFGY